MRSLTITTVLCLSFLFSSAATAEDLKIVGVADAGAADLPPSGDVAPADVRPTLPKAEMPTVAVSAATAEPLVDYTKRFKELDDRATVLTRQNELLKENLGVLNNKMAALEKRLSLLEEDSRYKLAALGFGLSVPTDRETRAAFKLHGNLKGFSAFYYAGVGAGVAWSMVFHVDRVRISPLGFGFMFYQDDENVFTSRWLNRSVDMVLPLAVDVRVWKGITVGAQVAWFIPNPVAVAAAAEDTGQSSIENANPQSEESLREMPRKMFDDSGELISRAFKDAFKSPRIEFATKWSF